jgi:hypothetical protein
MGRRRASLSLTKVGRFAKLDWKHLSVEIAFLCRISRIDAMMI